MAQAWIEINHVEYTVAARYTNLDEIFRNEKRYLTK